MTIRDILTNIRERLQKAGIEDFEYESWVLLEWKLHIDRAEFYMNPNGEVRQELLEELEEVLLKREQRVPLQYLIGSVSLWISKRCIFKIAPTSPDFLVLYSVRERSFVVIRFISLNNWCIRQLADVPIRDRKSVV